MTNKTKPFSLGLIFIAFGFIFLVIGIIASYIWLNTIYNWERHLNKAFYTGELLYDSITNNKAPPDGINIQDYFIDYSKEDSIKTLLNFFETNKPDIITAVPLDEIYLFIVSNKIKYPVEHVSFSWMRSSNFVLNLHKDLNSCVKDGAGKDGP